MSLKGGYQIINLKNREFSTTRNNMEYYKDIYFNLLNSHAKMIIVSGLNMDGVKYNDYETIFYEVEQPDDNPYFQCIARRIWNTKDYKCITKYINIYYDDRVMCTQEEFTYEILPDGEFSLTSTNAVQNKTVTKEIDKLYAFSSFTGDTMSLEINENPAFPDSDPMPSIINSEFSSSGNGVFCGFLVISSGTETIGRTNFTIHLENFIGDELLQFPYNKGTALVTGCEYYDENGTLHTEKPSIPCIITKDGNRIRLSPMSGPTGQANVCFSIDNTTQNYINIIGVIPYGTGRDSELS